MNTVLLKRSAVKGKWRGQNIENQIIVNELSSIMPTLNSFVQAFFKICLTLSDLHDCIIFVCLSLCFL